MRYSPEVILFAGSGIILVVWLAIAGLLSGLIFYFFIALGVLLIVIYGLRQS
jgi:hypothetical protein